MERLNKFIESLEEWKRVCHQTDLDFKGILFHLSYVLGDQNCISINSSEELKERVVHLIKEEHIKEKFLINSLINEVNSHFEHFINKHGEIILNNEFLAKSTKEEFGIIPDHIQKGIDKTKDISQLYNLENQYDEWKMIVLRNFSTSKQREFDRNEYRTVNSKG